MARYLTELEEALVELVHFLSSGDSRGVGLSLKEVKTFLTKPIKDRSGKCALDLIDSDGPSFLNDLKVFLNETEK